MRVATSCGFIDVRLLILELMGYPLPPPLLWNHGVTCSSDSKILIRLDLYGKYSEIRTYEVRSLRSGFRQRAPASLTPAERLNLAAAKSSSGRLDPDALPDCSHVNCRAWLIGCL